MKSGLKLAALLLLLAFACESEPPPRTITERVEARADVATSTCGAVDVAFASVDQPLAFSVRPRYVKQACGCITTQPQWGCGTICESEYDLGGPNTGKCDKLADEPVAAEKVSVAWEPDCLDAYGGQTACETPRHCEVTATIDAAAPQGVSVTLRCGNAMRVRVDVSVTTARGEAHASVLVDVSREGGCLRVHDAGTEASSSDAKVESKAEGGEATDAADLADAAGNAPDGS